MPAGIALLDVAAERRGAAVLDGAHDAALAAAERGRMFPPVGRAELAKDVRHLEPGGAQRRPQKCTGGGTGAGAGTTVGKRSKGLGVAHTVLVATFR